MTPRALISVILIGFDYCGRSPPLQFLKQLFFADSHFPREPTIVRWRKDRTTERWWFLLSFNYLLPTWRLELKSDVLEATNLTCELNTFCLSKYYIDVIFFAMIPETKLERKVHNRSRVKSDLPVLRARSELRSWERTGRSRQRWILAFCARAVELFTTDLLIPWRSREAARTIFALPRAAKTECRKSPRDCFGSGAHNRNNDARAIGVAVSMSFTSRRIAGKHTTGTIDKRRHCVRAIS